MLPKAHNIIARPASSLEALSLIANSPQPEDTRQLLELLETLPLAKLETRWTTRVSKPSNALVDEINQFIL